MSKERKNEKQGDHFFSSEKPMLTFQKLSNHNDNSGKDTFQVIVYKNMTLKNLWNQIETHDSKLSQYEYDVSFGGKTFDQQKTVDDVAKEVGSDVLRQPITFVKNEMSVAKEKLKQNTSLKWNIIGHLNILELKNDTLKNKKQLEEFKKDLFAKAPYLQGISTIEFSKKTGYGGGSQGSTTYSYYKAVISITGAAENIKRIIESDITQSAPIIAQDIRNPGEQTSFKDLPNDVLSKIGEFLAPTPDAGSKMLKEIQEAQDKHNKSLRFKKIKPIKLQGVRQSIGATVCLIVKNGMITEEQAKKGENIASIDFSKEGGMTFKFANDSYARQFYGALKNMDYKNVTNQKINENNNYGYYVWSVTIPDLNEIKQFIENTLGYSDQYTKDLFSGVKLPAEFFIQELTLIGKTSDSLSGKAEKATKFINDFLPYLDPSEAKSLDTDIQNKAATTGPLAYLREKRGFSGIFSSEKYGDTNTYITILKSINLKSIKKMQPLGEETTKNIGYKQ